MAYDRVMRFPGAFADSILPDKIDIMNVSFMVDRLEEHLGGCAGNIAYSLAVLGEQSTPVSSVGRDFDRYERALDALGVSLEGITRYDTEFTAGAYILTDRNNNQITAFNPGAMRNSTRYAFDRLGPDDFVIVSPGNVDDMRNIPRIAKEKGARCIFDPSQQLPVLDGALLTEVIAGAFMLVCNDYEFELICKKTGKTPAEILGMTQYAITTLGDKGSRVQTGGATDHVAAVTPREVVDPTGAGDAFRGGLLKGLSLGKSVLESARIGSAAASFCVEMHGTQAPFTLEECQKRHWDAFGANF